MSTNARIRRQHGNVSATTDPDDNLGAARASLAMENGDRTSRKFLGGDGCGARAARRRRRREPVDRRRHRVRPREDLLPAALPDPDRDARLRGVHRLPRAARSRAALRAAVPPRLHLGTAQRAPGSRGGLAARGADAAAAHRHADRGRAARLARRKSGSRACSCARSTWSSARATRAPTGAAGRCRPRR